MFDTDNIKYIELVLPRTSAALDLLRLCTGKAVVVFWQDITQSKRRFHSVSTAACSYMGSMFALYDQCYMWRTCNTRTVIQRADVRERLTIIVFISTSSSCDTCMCHVTDMYARNVLLSRVGSVSFFAFKLPVFA